IRPASVRGGTTLGARRSHRRVRSRPRRSLRRRCVVARGRRGAAGRAGAGGSGPAFPRHGPALPRHIQPHTVAARGRAGEGARRAPGQRGCDRAGRGATPGAAVAGDGQAAGRCAGTRDRPGEREGQEPRGARPAWPAGRDGGDGRGQRRGDRMMRISNTMTRTKEEFFPLVSGEVRMYVCGVTVYDYSHIGHARSAMVFDVIRRYLTFKGYRVTFVKNYTDVDDRIIKRANDAGVTPREF